jgi:GDP-mannose 6-dehydrogenase
VKVVVFGAGYVGSVTAGCLATLGQSVTVIDTVPTKVEAIRAGRSPVLERGLEELISRSVSRGFLRGEYDGARAAIDAEVAVVCVGTPSLSNGMPDTRPLQRVFQCLASSCQGRHQALTVVVRSTILAACVKEVFRNAVGTSRGAPQLKLVLNPEFLRETSAVADFFNPPFIVVGSEGDEEAAMALKLYDGIEAPRFKVSLETASLLKYACNAFHATKIAFANEMDTLASTLGADGAEVMQLLRMDKVLNISDAYLRPGFAFGGSCLTKDLRALDAVARGQHESLPLVSSILPSNRRRLELALERIVASPARRLTFVGLSFKMGSDDLRESPYLELAERLLTQGFSIKIFDPDLNPKQLIGSNQAHALVQLPRLSEMLIGSVPEAFQGSEAAVICKPLLSRDIVRQCLPEGALLFDLERPSFQGEPDQPVPRGKLLPVVP